MTDNDIEALLWGYVRWARQGEEWRRLGYPSCTAFAKRLPRTVEADGIPALTDAEGERIGGALSSLKRWYPDAWRAVEARFFYGVADDKEAGRRWKIGGANKVYYERLRAYTFLTAKLAG